MRKRRTLVLLLPPLYIVYPLPPASPEYVTKERPHYVSAKTSLAQQRRRAKSKLRPHLYVQLPPPPGPRTERVKVTKVAVPVRAVQIRRQTDDMYFLRRPVVVGAAPQPPRAAVKVTKIAVRTRILEVRLRAIPRSHLRAPVVVTPPTGGPMLGGIMTQFVQPPRVRMLTSYFLRPPTVVL